MALLALAGCAEPSSRADPAAPPSTTASTPPFGEALVEAAAEEPALPGYVTSHGCKIIAPNFALPASEVQPHLPEGFRPVAVQGVAGSALVNLVVKECAESAGPAGPLGRTREFLLMAAVVPPEALRHDGVDAYRFALFHVASPELAAAYAGINWSAAAGDITASLQGDGPGGLSTATTRTEAWTATEQVAVGQYTAIGAVRLRVFAAENRTVAGWFDLDILPGPRFYGGEGSFEATGDWPFSTTRLAGIGFQYGWDADQPSTVMTPTRLPSPS